MIIKDIEYGNCYYAGTITVEHNGKEYVIETIAGVHKNYLYPEHDDHILTDAETEFNDMLYRATQSCFESDSYLWSEKKQMFWVDFNGDDISTDDDDEPIPTENGCWSTVEEVKDQDLEMLNEWDELKDALIARVNDIEAAAAKEKALEEFMAKPAVIIKQGLCTRIKDNCPDLDYENILSERTGEHHHKIIAVCGRHMIEFTEANRYVLWYLTLDEAEPYSTYRTLEQAIERLGEEEYQDGEVPAHLLDGLVGEEV